MFKNLSLAAAALALGSTGLIAAAPASAQRYDRSYQNDNQRGDRYDRRDYRNDRRDDRGDYRRNSRDNRHYAREQCNDGDGGTIVGAIAGGLLGRTVAGGGDRLLGTVVGGVGGALAGRAIDRSDRPNYCRR